MTHCCVPDALLAFGGQASQPASQHVLPCRMGRKCVRINTFSYQNQYNSGWRSFWDFCSPGGSDPSCSTHLPTRQRAAKPANWPISMCPPLGWAGKVLESDRFRTEIITFPVGDLLGISASFFFPPSRHVLGPLKHVYITVLVPSVYI